MTEERIPIDQCQFSFRCPKEWAQLARSNIESIRYCNVCERTVYLSRDAEEAIGHARKGRCVAIPVELTDPSIAYPPGGMTVGVLEPPSG